MFNVGIDYYYAYKAAEGVQDKLNQSNVKKEPKSSAPDIQALSKELLVSQRKLQEKYKQSNRFYNKIRYKFFGTENVFDKYVEKKRDKYSKASLAQANKDYKVISQNYTFDRKGRATSKNGKALKGLTENMLMKIVRQSSRALLESNEKITRLDTKSLSKKKLKVLTGRDESNRLQVITWSGKVDVDKKDSNFIGKGTYGRVQRVNNIGLGKLQALKTSCPTIKEKKYAHNQLYIDIIKKTANQDATNESDIRKQINPDSLAEGIQIADEWNFEIDGSVALLQDLYSEGDLLDYIFDGKINKLSSNEKVQQVSNLFEGLKTVHDKNIYHGDIKPNNCLVGKKDGKLQIHLADFGGARTEEQMRAKFHVLRRTFQKVENGEKDTAYLGTTYTRGFFSDKDLDNSYTSLKDCNIQDWLSAQKQRDVYALAKTAVMLLTGRDSVVDNWYKKIQKEYGYKIADTLKAVLENDPKNRPDVSDIIATLNQ